jgi:hypothetical protein
MTLLISGAMIQQLADLPPALPALIPDRDADDPGRRDFFSTARGYVSADRVRSVLRNRLGCVETPRRDPDGTYWLAPDGRRFRVLHPHADPVGRPMVTSEGGTREVYSLTYVRALLSFLNED